MKKQIMDKDLRDQIIFGEKYKSEEYKGGLRYFTKLRRHELRLLMDKRIFDSHPWIRYMEFVWFMERYENDNQLYLHGFVYGPERKDGLGGRQGGICIEGIGRDNKWDDRETAEAVKVFKFLFGEADEFGLNPPYAWYD